MCSSDLAIVHAGPLTACGPDGWLEPPAWRPGRDTAAANPYLSPAARASLGRSLGLGAGGELRVAGMEWLGARVLDPAIQHLRFCPRQCALIHIEQQWSENFFTAVGRVQHEKVHGNMAESRKTVKTERNLKIASALLGVTGCTDAVEFYSDGKIISLDRKSVV